jgi:hypothetical protein
MMSEVLLRRGCAIDATRLLTSDGLDKIRQQRGVLNKHLNRQTMNSYNDGRRELYRTSIAVVAVFAAIVLRDVFTGVLSPVWFAVVVVATIVTALTVTVGPAKKQE